MARPRKKLVERPPFVACRLDGCNKDGVIQSWKPSAVWMMDVPHVTKCACRVAYEALQ